MSETFKDDEELRSLVGAFETCEIHPAEFKHYQHLAVAFWYVAELPYDQATEKMRNGIQQLAAAYGKTGYHETITLFWLRMVRDFFSRAPKNEPISAVVNRLIEKYANKNLISDYYSVELLNSNKAKHEWIEPDLKPLAPTD